MVQVSEPATDTDAVCADSKMQLIKKKILVWNF